IADGGSSADSFAGGADNDLYRAGAANLTLRINDSGGNDTLSYADAAAGDISAASLASVNGIEAIDLGGGSGQTLTLDAARVIAMSSTTDVLRVHGSGGDRLVLSGAGWVRVGTSGGVVTLTNGSATIRADESLAENLATDGNDTLTGAVGNDTIDGLGGNDSVRGLGGVDSLVGGNGNDTLDGGTDDDQLAGGNGNDSLIGDDGNDTLNGGAEGDRLSGGAGNDSIAGGDGLDWVSYAELTSSTQGVTVNLATGRATGAAGSDTLGGIENVLSGAGNDSVLGDGLANVLDGGLGADTLQGGLGDDSLLGGEGLDWASYGELTAASQGVTVNRATGRATGAAGSDTLSGIENVLSGAGNDSLLGDGSANVLDGGLGNDTLQGGLGNDSLLGRDGSDWVSYAELTATQSVDVSLATGRATTAGFEQLSGIENVLGGAGDDWLSGDSLANVLAGGGGNDVLQGGAGNDSISGGAGMDWVTYEELEAGQSVTVNLATGRATGAAGSDTLAGIENVMGGSGNDSLLGDNSANELDGDFGNDSLSGGGGDDTLNGYLGNDLLIGGTGLDQFIFDADLGATNVDTIQGYSVADDTILLDNSIFDNVGEDGTLAASAFFLGAAATTMEHRIIYNSTTGALLYDADGSGGVAAVQFATLTGVSGTIVSTEFLII
ncbi:MAG: calcium-binding protein, partial [bacterium]